MHGNQDADLQGDYTLMPERQAGGGRQVEAGR